MHRFSRQFIQFLLAILQIDIAFSTYECWGLSLIFNRLGSYNRCVNQCENLRQKGVRDGQLAVVGSVKVASRATNFILKNYDKRSNSSATSFLIGLRKNEKKEFEWIDPFYDTIYYPQKTIPWKENYPIKGPNVSCVTIEITKTNQNDLDVFLVNKDCYVGDFGCLCQTKNDETDDCREAIKTLQAKLFGISTVWITVIVGSTITVVVLIIPSKAVSNHRRRRAVDSISSKEMHRYENRSLLLAKSNATEIGNKSKATHSVNSKSIAQMDGEDYKSQSKSR